MSVGISTACFYPAATEEALRCVAEAGAKVTEVFFNSPSELEPDFLRRICARRENSRAPRRKAAGEYQHGRIRRAS